MSNQVITKPDTAQPVVSKQTFYLPEFGVNIEAATLDEAIKLAKKATNAKGVK